MRNDKSLIVVMCASLLIFPLFSGSAASDEGPTSCSGIKRVELSKALTDALPAGDQGYVDNDQVGVWGIFVYEVSIVTSMGTQAAEATPSTDADPATADTGGPVWYHMIGEATKTQECEEFVDETLDKNVANIVESIGAQKRYVEQQQVVTLMAALAEQLIDQAQSDDENGG